MSTLPVAESLPRLKRLLPRLKGRWIGVLGDLMLDRYLWGTATRLSPEAAVPVVDFADVYVESVEKFLQQQVKAAD